MSTESPSSSTKQRVRRTAARPRPFAVTVAVAVATLGLVAGALVAVNAVVGMRVDLAVPSPELFVTSSHQTVVLTANQQLRAIDIDDVSFTPEVPIAVTTSANRVTIAVETTLEYDTEYRIDVAGVAGSFDARARTVSRTFTTPPASLVVKRTSPEGDTLVAAEVPADGGAAKRALGSTPNPLAERVLFSHPSVSDFAAGDGRVLAAARAATDDHDELLMIDVGTANAIELAMPQPGFASLLDIESSLQLWGFRFEAPVDSADHSLDDVLLVGRGTGAPEPVLGVDGKPLRVNDWAFLPGRPALVALGVDGNVVLIDLRSDRAPVPLGGHASLVSTGIDGRSMVVGDDDAFVRHDLVSGATETIDFGLADGQSAYPSDAVVSGDLSVLSFYEIDPVTHLFVQRVIVRGDGPEAPPAELLFDSLDTGRTVSGIALTPNSRFVALELADATTGRSSTSVFDLDAEGGPQRVADIDGGAGEWSD